MSSLQDLLTSVAAHLDVDVPYEIKLRSGGFRTPYAIKEADSAKEIADACDLLPGDANIIWKAARGRVGGHRLPTLWTTTDVQLKVCVSLEKLCQTQDESMTLCWQMLKQSA